MKLKVVYRDGTISTINPRLPLTSGPENIERNMWILKDANGCDYWFNVDDGSFDGTGMAVDLSESEAIPVMRAMLPVPLQKGEN